MMENGLPHAFENADTLILFLAELNLSLKIQANFYDQFNSSRIPLDKPLV